MINAVPNSKIAPDLMMLIEDFREPGREGLVHSLGLFSATSSKPTRTVAFVHCDEDASFKDIARYGIQVNQSRGTVRTAIVPIDQLERLADRPAVHRLQPSRFLNLQMDVAAAKVHLPAFVHRTGLKGSGVVIGIVDTGIDPTHPAFAGRILRIWDQTLSGPGVPEGPYGAELTGNDMTVSRDTRGHGTHVAGIAAGEDAIYGGVAPEAGLVIVKSDLLDAHIADGIRYIFRVAGDLGRPVVVNLSLGGHADPHDGTDSLCRIIDAESGPGRIVCCAAGNEGTDNLHAQIKVAAGQTRTCRFYVPEAPPIELAGLNIWYSGRDEVEVAIESPGRIRTPFQKVLGSPQATTYQIARTRVRIATPDRDPDNHDYPILVRLDIPGSRVIAPSGTWKLVIRGVKVVSGYRCKVDAWVFAGGSIFSGQTVQNSMKIGSPGASAAAVTVASYTTRNKWIDIDGNDQKIKLTLNDISDFSSQGPLRNGAHKPDLAAPGAVIISALSADAQSTRSWTINAYDMVDAGTSMATPFVVGLVALLLQRNPELDPQRVKDLLCEHCAIPGQTAGSFNPKWGYGFIDAQSL